jgi:acyl-CoA thioesterase-1
VINAGVSGETSAGGNGRVNWILRQPVDIFVLELGGNDGLRGIPLTETKKNLQTILDKVRAKYPQAKLILAGMQIPPNMGEQYTTTFKNLYPELAAKNKITLIPFLLQGVGGETKLNQPDRIHPTPEGHKILAENVWSILKSEL